MSIRPARDSELALLQEIERAAGRHFAELGMTLVAEDEAPPLDTLREFADQGRAWVRTDEQDRPVAYLLIDEIDGCAHIEQVTVHPDAAGHGYGRELLEHLLGWTAQHGLPAITLTTYLEVPWNRPYYERLGYRVLVAEELTPGLRRIRESEAARGLDQWPRTAMRREVPTGR